jgi:hypothetical protein
MPKCQGQIHSHTIHPLTPSIPKGPRAGFGASHWALLLNNQSPALLAGLSLLRGTCRPHHGILGASEMLSRDATDTEISSLESKQIEFSVTTEKKLFVT